MGTRRKAGLICRALSLEVEVCTARMSKPCMKCGVIPHGVRLKGARGTGRHAQHFVMCALHGAAFANEASLALIEVQKTLGLNRMPTENVRF